MDRADMRRRILLVPLAVLVAALSASCDVILGVPAFPPASICDQIDKAPLQAPTSAPPPAPIFEDTGTIAAYHGLASAESTQSGKQSLVKIKQAVSFPSWATHATVFLNGWHLKYLSGDHHVAGLGTIIRNIKIDGGQVQWEALGAISDDNFDDPYSWSYAYTVVIWNAANINLAVNHTDGTCDPRDHRGNFYITNNESTTTALSVFASFIRSVDLGALKTIAILPRGFGFAWDGGDDHHLLQLGYNLDHSEIFVEQGKKYKKLFGEETPVANPPSHVDSGFASWQTYAIIKDNDSRRDYYFGETVSALGGNDLGVVQPPFAILPREKTIISACSGGSPASLQTQQLSIDNIPYRYAIPMLTGWELSYTTCGSGDQHVSEIGIWIDDIQYDPANPGTLRYTLSSVLRDEDNQPVSVSNHKVAILGMKAVPLRGSGASFQPGQAVPTK